MAFADAMALPVHTSAHALRVAVGAWACGRDVAVGEFKLPFG